MTSKVLVEGVGGVGGVIAANLDLRKYDVTLVTNNEAISSAINSNGIQLINNGQKKPRKLVAFTKLQEVSGEYDIVLLVMKATEVLRAVEDTKPYLSKNGFVVTMQNGIVEDTVGEVVGSDRVVSAIVGWGGTMHSPGVYEKTSRGQFHIGELNGEITKRLLTLKDLLETVSPVIPTKNIIGALWSKLAINSCVTTLGAITGEKLGGMMKDKLVRELFLDIYQEVVDTATAAGISLERIAANPYLFYRKKNSSRFNSFIRHQLLKITGRKYSNIKSSMLQSVERGRKTEIRFLNGYVVNRGKELDVPTPVNRKAVDIVSRIEAGEITPSMRNTTYFTQG